MQQKNPTEQFYRLLNEAYQHFNERLFLGKLPWCMLTLQRSRNTMGYFSPERWVDGAGLKAHEIALNPSYFARHLIIDVLQTLVHEQCHLWQYLYGQRKSRTGYHNKEWADKMESIGLIPSDTGEVGGQKTGQTMSDYPAPNGLFLSACIALCGSEYSFEWIDTEPAWQESSQPRIKGNSFDLVEEIKLVAPILFQPVPTANAVEEINWAQPDQSKKLSKSKYSCPECSKNVWGKPGLNIVCGDCHLQFAH